MDEDDTVNVVAQRNNQEIMLHYTLQDFRSEKETNNASEAVPTQQTLAPEKLKQEQRKILEQKYNFAPTAQDIREQERRNMLQQGRRNSITPIIE